MISANSPALPVQLRPEVLDAILAGLRVGHRVAADKHEPDLGMDGFTYGTMAWRVSTRWIINEVNLLPSASAREVNNSLRIFADGFIISVYAGGGDATWDVDLFDFDRGTPSKRGIPRRNALNLQLSFDDLSDPVLQSPDVLDELTVVHCGNPQDELAAAYIGAAVFDDEIGRTKWAWTRPIFRLDDAVLSHPIATRPSRFMPHDSISLPEVPLTMHDDRSEEASDDT